MKRISEGKIPTRPRVAVVANDAIGNFVITTPILQMIREEWDPQHISYFGGRRTAELQSKSDLFDSNYLCWGVEFESKSEELSALRGEFDLILNFENSPQALQLIDQIADESTFVVGPSTLQFEASWRGELWQDQNWISPNITQSYPDLRSGFLCEIFARLFYLNGDVPAYRLPAEPSELHIPHVLIAMSASLPEKVWSLEAWKESLGYLQAKGLSIGLIGAKPKDQSQFWLGVHEENEIVQAGLAQDLRGALSLPQVVWALNQCKLILTLDNGIMHLAASTCNPVVALFREGIHRLWCPPFGNIHPVVAEPTQPVNTILPSRVVEKLSHVL